MRRAVAIILPPLVALLIAIGAWDAYVRVYDVPRFLLPSPFEVAQSISRDPSKLLQAMTSTGMAAVAALTTSIVCGVLTGFVFAQSTWVRRSLYPYAVFLQTVPIIAIAPLIVLWLGYGMASIVTVATVVSVFPVITAATAGLTRVDPALVDVFHLYGASRWQMLWKLRIPSAVPSIITGARTSSGLTVIGAIVGEFFTGANGNGLGYLIRISADQSRTPDLFAAVLASTGLGVCIFSVVSGAGAAILNRWYDRPA